MVDGGCPGVWAGRRPEPSVGRSSLGDEEDQSGPDRHHDATPDWPPTAARDRAAHDARACGSRDNDRQRHPDDHATTHAHRPRRRPHPPRARADGRPRGEAPPPRADHDPQRPQGHPFSRCLEAPPGRHYRHNKRLRRAPHEHLRRVRPAPPARQLPHQRLYRRLRVARAAPDRRDRRLRDARNAPGLRARPPARSRHAHRPLAHDADHVPASVDGSARRSARSSSALLGLTPTRPPARTRAAVRPR